MAKQPKMILAAPAEQLEKQIRRSVTKETGKLKRKLNWKSWLRRQIKWRWLKSIVPR